MFLKKVQVHVKLSVSQLQEEGSLRLLGNILHLELFVQQIRTMETWNEKPLLCPICIDRKPK